LRWSKTDKRKEKHPKKDAGEKDGSSETQDSDTEMPNVGFSSPHREKKKGNLS
jgi:hypothetical protein